MKIRPEVLAGEYYDCFWSHVSCLANGQYWQMFGLGFFHKQG
jgi:hypothetical protein